MKEAPLLMGIQWVSTDTNLCLVWDYLYVQTRGRYLYTHAQGKDETIMNQQEETLIDTLTNEDNPWWTNYEYIRNLLLEVKIWNDTCE